MLFLLVSTLLAGRPIVVRAAISLALAFLVEISQLYHAPWIDSIRSTTLGELDSGLTSVCLKPSTRVSFLRLAGVGVWFVRSRKQSSM